MQRLIAAQTAAPARLLDKHLLDLTPTAYDRLDTTLAGIGRTAPRSRRARTSSCRVRTTTAVLTSLDALPDRSERRRRRLGHCVCRPYSPQPVPHGRLAAPDRLRDLRESIAPCHRPAAPARSRAQPSSRRVLLAARRLAARVSRPSSRPSIRAARTAARSPPATAPGREAAPTRRDPCTALSSRRIGRKQPANTRVRSVPSSCQLRDSRPASEPGAHQPSRSPVSSSTRSYARSNSRLTSRAALRQLAHVAALLPARALDLAVDARQLQLQALTSSIAGRAARGRPPRPARPAAPSAPDRRPAPPSARRPSGSRRSPLAQVPGRAAQQLAREVLVDVQARQRPRPLLGRGDAQREERPLGAPRARETACDRSPCASRRRRSARPPGARSSPRPVARAVAAASRPGSPAAPAGSETIRVSSIRIALGGSVANTGRSSSIIRSRPSGLAVVAARQHPLDAEAHERHRRLRPPPRSPRAPSRWTARPGRCPPAAAPRAARACAWPRGSTARSIASWPALSASSASSTVWAIRASSPTCSRVSAVPISPTALRIPAWCSAITSV